MKSICFTFPQPFLGKLARALLLLLSPLLFLYGTCNEAPVKRPGAAYEGSAFWARDLAQPRITSFAADAQIYSVLGAVIYNDGRLPSNKGTWSFVAWSAAMQKQIQVTVRYDGHISESIRDATSGAPSGKPPLPAGWVNSTTIFNAIAPHVSFTTSTLATFNFSESTVPGVWGINTPSGNHYVQANGTYLGTSPPP